MVHVVREASGWVKIVALGKGRSETLGLVFQEFVIVSVVCRLKCLLSDMVPGVACGVRVGLTVPLRVCVVDSLVWLPMQGSRYGWRPWALLARALSR